MNEKLLRVSRDARRRAQRVLELTKHARTAKTLRCAYYALLSLQQLSDAILKRTDGYLLEHPELGMEWQSIRETQGALSAAFIGLDKSLVKRFGSSKDRRTPRAGLRLRQISGPRARARRPQRRAAAGGGAASDDDSGSDSPPAARSRHDDSYLTPAAAVVLS